MSRQPFRLDAGGAIDRSRPLSFSFNGETLEGYAGDSLASALLANGVRLIGRSFKYHRPRGIMTAGPEEPNALVQLGSGAESEPNIRATEVVLREGLVARSQNCWPSVGFDLGAVTNMASRLFPAGFYYKTFMHPARLWHSYERVIRRMAGMGEAPRQPDPDAYEKHYAHCDVLVVGGGPAGLMAALAAGRSGARVVLAEAGAVLGGSLVGGGERIDDQPADDWVARAGHRLAEMEEVTVLKRTTAFGYYDQNLIGLVQEVAGEAAGLPRQRLWLLRAKRVVLATGAMERPLVFADNDRPGVMLASAAACYARRYAVKAGTRAVVFTNNDSAYDAAFDLAAAGIDLAAVVDLRPEGGADRRARLAELGCELLAGQAIVATHGGQQVWGVETMRMNAAGDACEGPHHLINCDLVCSSGGWNPTAHLFSQSRGRLRFDAELACFRPEQSAQAEASAGSARGSFGLADCLAEGRDAGAAAAAAAGFEDGGGEPLPKTDAERPPAPLRRVWQVPGKPHGHAKCFVDHQDDVTAADIALAAREGFVSVEHLKRYTTLGMGTDQGKTSNVNGLGIMAELLGVAEQDVGTTTFRPPYTPVTMSALAGREVGAHFAPLRRTPMHAWHEAQGAVFGEAGLWRRPRFYPRAGEDLTAASHREARHVRRAVGMVDVSTLGKIDIQGRDAAEFLNRVYINGFAKLAVGRVRYGVMLRDDGMASDDGTTTRLGENHYLMTTTTANAGPVMTQLERHLQVDWPGLDVHIASVTDLWAAIAITGPQTRAVLERLEGDVDFSNRGLPFMGFTAGRLAGLPARVFRISFSGELGFEIAVAANHGQAMWDALLEAGRDRDLVAYGTEALGLLRIEKGHVVIGAEIDGRTTADDLGFGGMLSKTKSFVGQRSLGKPALAAEGREQLIGLMSVDGKSGIPAGAQLVADPEHPLPIPMLGHVTSTCYSPNLERPIAIAMLAGGRARLGEELYAVSPLKGATVRVVVCSAHFIDPQGERMRA